MEVSFVTILEELEGDTDCQAMLDKDIDDEEEAEESLLSAEGIADSDAIDMVAGLNDPNDPDYIDIYAL